MAIQTITYTDKVALNENPNVAEINKVTDDNMNEIKSVVNNNATETSTNTTNITTNTTKITNLQTYSTNETNTGQIWINGKPIYRKVVAVDFPTTTFTTISYPHNISNIDMITDYHLIWYDTEDARWYNYFKDTTGTFVQIDGISTTQIRIKSAGTSVNWQTRTRNRYAIIEYTKTTD